MIHSMKLNVTNFSPGDTILGRCYDKYDKNVARRYLYPSHRESAHMTVPVIITIVKINHALTFVDVVTPDGQVFYCYETDTYDCIGRL